MSLFGSLFSGASGLTAQSRAMGMISDNIANVNTTGYKGALPDFASLVTRIARRVTYSPGGVRAFTSYAITKQGLVQSTDSPTDAAISGGGFFVVNSEADSSGEQLYTRAGNFTPDYLGNLVTPSGFYLQGWALDANEQIADINRLETVNVRVVNGVALATTQVTLGANLDSTQATYTGVYNPGDLERYVNTDGANGVQPHFKRDLRIYDSFGNPHTLTIAFLKTADNNWAAELFVDPGELQGAPADGLLASGTVTFNGDGSLASVDAGLTNITINWAGGADPSVIRMNYGTIGETDGLIQFAADSDVSYIEQNGAEVGRLKGVTIDEDGYIIATFTNGAQRRIYRLPIATFPNPTGLDPRSGSVFAQTDASGEYNLRFAGESGAGRIVPAALEMANVDIADEFTKMIVTQRAYTASARVVSAVDQMLDELMRIKR